MCGRTADQQRRARRALSGQDFLAREYYPISVGSEWTYEIRTDDETFPVTVAVAGRQVWQGREVYKVMFSQRASKLLGYNEVGLVKFQESDEGEEEIFDPAGVILPDLVYGQARTFHPRYVARSEGSNTEYSAKAEMTFWIEAVETVKVPAGTFRDCMKMGYYDRWEEEDGSYDISRGLMWFAKGIGIVKIQGTGRQMDPDSGRSESIRETHVLLSTNVAPAQDHPTAGR